MRVLLILLAAAVAAALAMNWLRRRPTGGARRAPPGPMPRDLRGMKLVPGEKACGKALGLAGKMLPPEENPTLPIAGCTRKRCNCRFQPVAGRRWEDRRTRTERRAEVRYGPDQAERRSGRDRRKGGWDPWERGGD